MKVIHTNMKVLLLTFLFLMPNFCILASGNDIEADDIAMTAKEKYIKADYKKDLFDPAEANPSYKEDLKFKKIHE